MSRLRIMALAAVVLLTLAAACTPQEPDITLNDQVPADQRTEEETPGADGETGGDAGAGDSTFVAIDIDFESAPTELPAGEVEITLVNEGQALHNVTIPTLGGETPIVEATPGETASDIVTLEPGTYEYFCSVPGHESLMSGEFTVE